MGITPREVNGVKRLGILGGAFDPPHRAHFALARAALEQLELDELRVIPTGHAWHKTRVLTPAAHRLAMCELTFSGLAGVVVDPIETQRSGASFTIDTLQALKAHSGQAQMYLVLGQDQAAAFATWRRWDEIAQLAIICVADRAGSTSATSQFEPELAFLPQMHRLDLALDPISATDIRHRVADHKSIAPLVFDSVARYIEQHHLYRTT